MLEWQVCGEACIAGRAARAAEYSAAPDVHGCCIAHTGQHARPVLSICDLPSFCWRSHPALSLIRLVMLANVHYCCMHGATAGCRHCRPVV